VGTTRGCRRLVAGALTALTVAAVVPATAKVVAVPIPRVPSGTLGFAEAPDAAPNYILPFTPCSDYSVANLNQFQMLMYRPLYWFGLGASTAVQYPLSLASAPVFAGTKQVTIDLKEWSFSDGQRVDAESVAFFLNLYRADPTAYCGYASGFGIPDQLASVSYPGGLSGATVVLHFAAAVSRRWLIGNALSEITPFPEAWDRTTTGGADGSGGCATAAYGSAGARADCVAVERFLDAQAKDTSTYTDAMWQTVDGPWTLSAFDAAGDATFVPNPSYGGPNRPLLAMVVERAFLTTVAEENALFAGTVQVGYVDPSALPGSAPAPGETGANVAALAGRYLLESDAPWSFNYAPFNFATSVPAHAAIDQLYVRQALQLAVDQPRLSKVVDRNYAWPTVSPLPPVTPGSIAVAPANPYPHSAVRARSLLVRHGWKVVNGVQTCERPGAAATDCGAGIAKGYKLELVFAISSPSASSVVETANTEVSDWRGIGIKTSVLWGCGINGPCNPCTDRQAAMCSWGGGWVYAPDHYPTGESLLATTGSNDVGDYSNAEMTALILRTTQGSKLTAYARYAAQQLPVLYEPTVAATAEVGRSVKCTVAGACVQSPVGNFMPEYMHY
jgi:peptide/nickel transport system substrate-binding protein